MFRIGRLTLCATLLFISLIGCGGSGPGAKDGSEADGVPKMTAEDMIPRAVLRRAELTDEADEERFRVKGEVLTEFPPDQPVIYLVAKLKRVPTQAKIEVRWFRDADPQPVLVSRVHGSDSFSFVADLRPSAKTFVPGPYSARVFVDDRPVGQAPFRITGDDPDVTGPRISGVAVSKKVSRKMRPKGKATKFKAGTKTLHVTFDVSGAKPDSIVHVVWTRNGEDFSEQEIPIAPEGRFGAHVESPSGLPDGRYTVEIVSGRETLGSKPFVVGRPGGAGVDKVALGLALGNNSIPTKERTTFKADHPAISCGLRFLDLPTDSVIELLWTKLLGDEESTYHTSKSTVPSGGTGTMGAVWEPPGGFEDGDYRLVVMLNGVRAAQLDFRIE